MTDGPRASRAAARDGALTRLRWLRRGLAGAAVLLTVLLANAAAQAFPGHARTVSATSPVPLRQTRTTSPRDRSHRRARRSASTPTPTRTSTSSATESSTSGAAQPISPPAAPPQAAPAVSAPAPVTSGGS